MTDNTQELDDILFDLCDLSYASFTTQEEADRVADQLDYDRAKAKQAIIDWNNKQVGNAMRLGYVEAWKVIAGRYANTSNEDSYLYVSDLIKSLEEDDGHQMRVIQSNKTGKQCMVALWTAMRGVCTRGK